MRRSEYIINYEKSVEFVVPSSTSMHNTIDCILQYPLEYSFYKIEERHNNANAIQA